MVPGLGSAQSQTAVKSRTTGDGVDSGPAGSGHLDRSESHRATRPHDEHPLAGSDPHPVAQCPQGSQAAQDQGAVLDPGRVTVREEPAARGLDGEQFDRRSSAAQRLEAEDDGDPRARDDSFGAAVDYLPDGVEAGLLREEPVRKPAASVHDIDPTHCAGEGAHEDLSLTQARRGHILDPENLGSATAVVLHGPHFSTPRPRARRARRRSGRRVPEGGCQPRRGRPRAPAETRLRRRSTLGGAPPPGEESAMPRPRSR